jgi:hypothetical protein
MSGFRPVACATGFFAGPRPSVSDEARALEVEAISKFIGNKLGVLRHGVNHP